MAHKKTQKSAATAERIQREGITDAALVSLVRLLARQAARQQFEACDDANQTFCNRSTNEETNDGSDA